MDPNRNLNYCRKIGPLCEGHKIWKRCHTYFDLDSVVFYQISVNFSETWTLMMLRPILELKRGDEMARFSHLIAIIYLKHKGYFKMLFLNLTLIQKLLPDEFKLAALFCWLLKRLSPFVDILVLIMNFFPKKQKRTRA